MVAAENPKVCSSSFCSAGPGLKGVDLLAWQTQAIDLSMGVPGRNSVADRKLRSQIIKALLSSGDTSIQFENAWKTFLTWKKNTKPEIVSAIGINADTAARDFIRTYLEGLNKPWMLYFLQSRSR